ncbi:TetR family transcriptional regulator [Nostoc sp. 'Peltigera membranacea cyanobiont' 210A]|uniref:TetR/AcrR family transcriptional regulator n=1 Tax=Nostoc sp. 'Peltigera membranacea cyanobiont' 210A TaxID=2014529 RepID=UPI000B954565|nr:TetR/AcrR family transcriptional regulator [Nostoc sp. 'Peltigera membranacea cyanobiont' 210A]OYD94710.1 TetR family transcriptional regulator [Nostoc sp. 'Peltigera membranacea cyanobiont' 210A]
MPKIVDHEQYRKELLDKCFDLFAQKGYASITMRQIAEELRVSTGTLYHYFSSKQALFEQLAQEICEQDLSTALAELEGAQTLQESMEALGRYLVKNEDYFIKWTYIWIDFCQHKDSKEMLKNSIFKRTNQRYQEAACDFLGIQDPVLASFVLSFVNGLILEKLWGDETIDFIEQCALLGKILTVYLPQHQSETKTTTGFISGLES